MKLQTIALCTLLGAASLPVVAQPVLYLQPARFAARVGERLELRLVQEIAGRSAVAPWPGQRIEWFFVRGGGEQTNRHQVLADGPLDEFVTIRLEQADAVLIGLDLQPQRIELSAAGLKAFAREHLEDAAVLAAIEQLPDSARVAVRRVESAKTVVRVVGPRNEIVHSAGAQGKTGQPVEIRPLFDPTLVRVGSDMPVRAYVQGDKCPAVRFAATAAGSGRTQVVRADETGSAYFRITEPGPWRVVFHDLRAADQPEAPWVLYTGTLTFEVSQQESGR